jgi:hypothetical protein
MEISENSIKLMARLVCGESRYAPYKSGPELVRFFNQFGINDEYGKGFPSRGDYTENKLKELNGSTKLKEVIEKTLEPENFTNKEFNIEIIVNQVNEFLIPEGYEIKKENNDFKITYNESYLSLKDKVKNIIFASVAARPEIIISELNGQVEIIKNEESCLVYNFDIAKDTGLLWKNLVDWWAKKNNLSLTFEKAQNDLYLRLYKSLVTTVEKILFKTYYKKLKKLGENLPALIPQVYYLNDPFNPEINKGKQRIDFLLILKNNKKIIIQVDANQHFADEDKFSPGKYAAMMSGDRELKLKGFEVYRFGSFEFKDENIENNLEEFFILLFEKY